MLNAIKGITIRAETKNPHWMAFQPLCTDDCRFQPIKEQNDILTCPAQSRAAPVPSGLLHAFTSVSSRRRSVRELRPEVPLGNSW